MTYYRRLVFALRRRGLPEQEVLDVLAEAQTHCLAVGQGPEQALGPAREFAASFAKGDRWPVGLRVFYASVLVGLVQIITVIWITRANDLDHTAGPVAWVLEIALGIFLAGYLTGQGIDRRLPPA